MKTLKEIEDAYRNDWHWDILAFFLMEFSGILTMLGNCKDMEEVRESIKEIVEGSMFSGIPGSKFMGKEKGGGE